MSLTLEREAQIGYQPILDVARGVTAGYHAQTHGMSLADTLRAVLDALTRLPANTFIATSISLPLLGRVDVQGALSRRADLRGLVLDITDFTPAALDEVGETLAGYRAAGALISVGGQGSAQPELTSIVRLKPAIIRLGRAWVRGVDSSDTKRSAVELTGRLAGQLDAWILAEGVETSAELRALAELGVPLAQGSFVGEARPIWSDVDLEARIALPDPPAASDGMLRALLQSAYTTRHPDHALRVLPDTSGFDVVVVLDEFRRPVSLLENDGAGSWSRTEAMSVNIDTSVHDAVERAMARPKPLRLSPLACTDEAGRLLGVLRIERLLEHLTRAS